MNSMQTFYFMKRFISRHVRVKKGNVMEEVPGPEVSPSRRESGATKDPPEANSSEMHSEPLREAVLSNDMNGDDSDESQKTYSVPVPTTANAP